MSDQMVFTAIASGVASITTGAMIVVIRMFLKSLNEKDEQFTEFLGNHMSRNTKAMEDVVSTLSALSSEVRFARMAASGSRVDE